MKTPGFFGRNGGILFDEFGHNTAQGLDSQGKRGDIQQQDIVDVPLKHSGLYGCTHGHHFIRVNAFMGFFAENLFHPLLNGRHTGHAAHQNDFIHAVGSQIGLFQCFFAGTFQIVQQICHQRFQFRPCQLYIQMLGTGRIGRDERQIDIGLSGAGQFHLAFPPLL